MAEKSREKQIIKLNRRLREMSQDPKFTDEDREEIHKQIKKLDLGKLDLGKLRTKPKELIEAFDTKTNRNVFISKDKLKEDEDRYAVKKYKGGLMVKPKRAKGGY